MNKRVAIYRDLLLLHLGVAIVAYEQFLTPPPFDTGVGVLAAALLTAPLSLRRDEKKREKRADS